MYGGADGDRQISAEVTGYDWLASVKTGQLLRLSNLTKVYNKEVPNQLFS